MVLKQESAENLTIQKAVTRIGQQEDKKLWILGEGVQINAEGELIPREEQVYVWLDWSIEQGLGNEGVYANNSSPTQNTQCESSCTAASHCNEHKFIPSILVMAGSVVTLHYCSLILQPTGFPTIVAYGPSQTGKSTPQKTALSIKVYALIAECFFYMFFPQDLQGKPYMNT